MMFTDTIEVSVELRRVHRTMKDLFGPRWEAKVDEHRALFALTMHEHKVNELGAVLALQRKAWSPMPADLAALLLAIAVDLILARQPTNEGV
jgi:hypothetical protein